MFISAELKEREECVSVISEEKYTRQERKKCLPIPEGKTVV